MAQSVWQNRSTGGLFATPEVALAKATEKTSGYDYSEYWILPEKDGVVIILKKEYGSNNWTIFFQLHLTQVVEN